MTEVELKDVSKSYGGAKDAVSGISFTVEPGEFFTLLGPSGCGKTTTLRLIAGLEAPNSGQIWIDGSDATAAHPRDRGVGFMFQSYALYPHLSVFDNIALNLRIERVPRQEISRRVHAIAKTMQIDSLLDRRPARLSGGERQRVALGRALVRNPKVLLMDEPLSNLDLKLREDMRTELKRLHEEYRHTVICVTHDQAEAMVLSDRIAVMRAGVIQQIGSPQEVYRMPANASVARFIGSPSINLLSGRIRAGADRALFLPDNRADEVIVLQPNQSWGLGDPVDQRPVNLGIRAEDVLIHRAPVASALAAEVDVVEPTGAFDVVVMRIAGSSKLVTAIVGTQETFERGDSVHVSFRPGRRLLFDAVSDELIGSG